MLNTKFILNAILDKCSTAITLVTTVVLPEQKIDVQTLVKWVDVSVITFNPRAGSRIDKDTIDLDVMFRVWCKKTTNAYEHQKIAAEIATNFEHSAIPIYDNITVGSPRIGFIDFKEANTANLTTQSESQLRTNTRCITVSFRATAQEF